MKTIRIIAWSLVVLLVGAVSFVWLNQGNQGLQQLAGAGIGGPFTLSRTDGTVFTEKDIAGKPYAIFFGFTNCPEVCPTTLYEASGWLEQLGSDADKIGIYFVTVDPERDTPELIAEYVSSFDKRIVGLTGTPEQIETIKKEYRVFSQKVDLEGGGYTIDHTASIYLMHGDGSFAGTIAWGEDGEIALKKIRNLISRG
ncbi:MAG: SCO family protein [Nitratireductor sp.]|nr:SCO family protein [Nitratireductor sp.]